MASGHDIITRVLSRARNQPGKRWLTGFALTAAVMVATNFPVPGARADVITQFELDNFVFTDGTTATGSFTFDEFTDKITEWNISYFGGGASGVPSFLFTNDGTQIAAYAPNPGYTADIDFYSGCPGPCGIELLFGLTAPLAASTNSIVTGAFPIYSDNIGLLISVIGDEANSTRDYFTSGQLDPIPEPPAIPTLTAALGLLLLSRRLFRRSPTAS